ncbi:hypothetical protein PTKIN_Ptkin09bG0241500 [Pterospermum kingtungense]
MANAAGEEMATQIYAKPENGSGTGSTTYPSLIDDLISEALQENPKPDSEIQKAVKLLDERQAYGELRCYEENSFRRLFIRDAKKLASLKRDIDKLTFANNAYKERAIKTEENIINYRVRIDESTLY